MARRPQGVVTTAEERRRESWGGTASWFTLISGDVTPTDGMTAGIMEIAPDGGELAPHRHAPAELYHVLEGEGVLSLDGVEHPLRVGSTAFIPGDAEHAVRNHASGMLRIFYVFPTDGFADVVYRFREPAP